MDHANRAANRHVLQVKSRRHAFHIAPLLWNLLLPFGSDPAEKKGLAHGWRVRTIRTCQVGM
eukprot:2635179-Amphidinium_carterae.1